MTRVPLRVMFNVPNTLCWVRLLGSPALPMLAYTGSTSAVAAWFLLLLGIDMIDGRLARHLHQRTRFGSRLDTAADAMLFVCLVLAVALLQPAAVMQQLPWIVAAMTSYLLNVALSYLRFDRWPSYHTRLAKMTGGVVGLAALVVLFTAGSWPIAAAAALATLTNLEAAALSLVLRVPRTDVPTIYHALRLRRA